MKFFDDIYLYIVFNKRKVLSILLAVLPSLLFIAFVSSKGSKAMSTDQISNTSPLEEVSDSNLNTIKIFISGAVNNPGVYELTEGSRVLDALNKSGGISYLSSYQFVMQEMNLSQKLSDGQKIYIPFEWDVQDIGSYNISTINNITQSTPSVNNDKNGLLNVNTATSKELETLPGVGPATAQRIIDNRPYISIDDLSTKAKLSDTVKEKIQDLISF